MDRHASMNRAYTLVWSEVRQCYVPAPEGARSRGKRAGATVALVAGLLAASGLATAAPTLPSGASVSAGTAAVAVSGKVMTITQGTPRAAINWQQFSIGQDHTVQFIQPGSGAVALNRVVGNEASVLNGALTANGQVFLLNPNGILIGKQGRIDTAGLVASTLALGDADFMAGKTSFSGNGSRASVINLGTITAREGGYAALLGAEVRNQGVISATLGSVALAAGNKLTLNFNGNSLLGVVVEQGVLNALVDNGNAVQADGGSIVLTAKGLDSVLGAVVNNTGELRAQSIATRQGRIYLLAQDGTAQVGGSLRAEGGAQDGGFIETSGKQVAIAPGTVVSTKSAAGRDGHWLIDPTDFNIDSGGASQSASGIGATTLETALAAGNVTIQTQTSGGESGDLNVNAPVSWSANKLTLEAAGDINVNATLTASGSSTLNLKTGYNFDTMSPSFDRAKTLRMGFDYSNGGFAGRINFDRGGAGLLTVNGEAYTLISSLGAAGSTSGSDLQGMNGALAGRFALANDINAAATSGWNSGKGFAPIGLNTSNGSASAFTGRFDGLGHTISGLAVAREWDGLGLFSKAGGDAILRNVGLPNANIRSSDAVVCDYGCGRAGALAGQVAAANQNVPVRINNAYSTGSVTSEYQSGGLVGQVTFGMLDYTYSNATVASSQSWGSQLGGLVGDINGAGANYTTQTYAAITRSWTSGATITSASTAGGLVGSAVATTIEQSYSTSNVVGVSGAAFGGLAGYVYAFSVIRDAYARGSVSAPQAYSVGGLVGQIDANGVRVFQNVYASGAVTPVTAPGATKPNMTNKISGGLVATWWSGLPVTTAFWDTTNSLSYSGTGSGKSATELKTTSTFTDANWNFTPVTGVWRRRDDVNNGYPVLRAFGGKDQLSVYIASPVSMTYGDAGVPVIAGTAISEAGCGINGGCLAGLALGSMFSAATAAGNYGFNSNGVLAPTFADPKYARYFDVTYYSGSAGAPQAGYVAVNPRPVNISLNPHATRVYDGSTDAAASLFSVSGAVNGDTLNLAGAASLAGKGVGSQAVSSLAGLGLGNANYTTAGVSPSGTVQITPRTLTISALSGQNRVYDGGTAASFTTVDDHVSGDAVRVTATAAFADKQVGTAKSITLGSLGLEGADAANYTLAGYTPGSVTADITARPLTAVFSGVTRPYDGGTAVSLSSSDDRVAGDVLSLSASGAFGDKQAGSGKPIAVSAISLSGADAGNYSVAGSASATGTISPRVLTAIFTGQNRTYDGSLAAQVSAAGDDRVAGDVLSISASGAFADKHVGQHKAITVSGISIGGADGANYVAGGTPAMASASITPRTLTVGALSGLNRAYDGSTAAGIALAGDDRVAGDQLGIQGQAVFADKQVGTGKAISATGLALTGADAGNYVLASTSGSAVADITKRDLALNFSVAPRVYDGGTGAQVSVGDNRVAGDILTLSASGSFSDKNAGSGKTVAIGGVSLTGADSANYQLLTPPATAQGTITPRPLNLSFAGRDRGYDGTLAVEVSASDDRVSGDSLTVAASGRLASKAAGVAREVAVSGIALGGADAGNYQAPAAGGRASVTISPRVLELTLAAADKVYDGNTAVAVHAVGDNRVAGDQLDIRASGRLADKQVGQGKAVALGELEVGGADAANYRLVRPATPLAATVTARLLTPKVAATARPFDGGTALALTVTGDDRVAGDQLTLSAAGSLADPGAGTGKAVTLAPLVLGGADSANYRLAAPAAVVADVQQRSVSYVLSSTLGSELQSTGKDLATAATLDQWLVATLRNAVPNTPAGQLSYTIWKGGSQVAAIREAGDYVIRAQFARADANYVIDEAASQSLTLSVRAHSLPEPAANVAAQAALVRPTAPAVPALSVVPAGTAAAPAASGASLVLERGGVAEPVPSVARTFGSGQTLAVLSAPVAGEQTAGVTLDEARRMLGAQAGGDGASQDVRVPVSRNSLAEIVNGGVKLPDGVNQLLYVVNGKQ